MSRIKPVWTILIMADLIFFTAPVVFVVVAITSGMAMDSTMDALIAQYKAERSNLLVTSLLALFPLLLLAMVLWTGRRFGKFATTAGPAALGGSIGIWLVTVFVNVEYWPTFLPELRYAGWPHGIELVLGPLIAAPIAMIVGVVLGALAARQ